MRTSIASVLALAAGIAGFGAGAWTSAARSWGSDAVSATIVNRSATPVERAYVRFESCGLQGTAIVGMLRPGQARTVRYSVCGEGGYTIEAQLAGGKVLRSAGGYVERGYRTEEVVGDDAIQSSQSIH